jgi:Zn finger protein HypA/HybF involved in hydrogenase expression
LARGLRERGLSPAQVRLAVRGGHHEPSEFEAQLRSHLTAEMPGDAVAVACMEIRRAAFGHLCPRCGVEFETERVAPVCPACGVDTVAEITDEIVEIELLAAVR